MDDSKRSSMRLMQVSKSCCVTTVEEELVSETTEVVEKEARGSRKSPTGEMMWTLPLAGEFLAVRDAGSISESPSIRSRI